ncbi:unnamed protein product, partial [Rotaria sp. Silwood1]
CAKTFLTLMSKLFKQQTLRYLLTLMDQCLREDKSRVEIFNTYAKMKKEQENIGTPLEKNENFSI